MMKPRVLVAILAAGIGGMGCSSKKDPEPAAAKPAEVAAKPAGLCIDPGDIQIEPLDLEGIDDEMPSPELGDSARKLVEGFLQKSSPVAVAGGRFAVAFVRCRENRCEPGVMVMEGSGEPAHTRPLPGVNATGAGETNVSELISAPADVDSDGQVDLWVSYRSGDPESGPSEHHVVALSLPELAVEWHGVVSSTAKGEDGQGCDGTLYPVDADCDGDGDLVLVQRCGPMKCINDDSATCPADAVTEKVAVYRWNVQSGPESPASGTYE